MGIFGRLFGKRERREDETSKADATASGVVPPQDAAASETRLGYEDSCKRLGELGFLEAGRIPPMPPRMPRYDDEEPLGLNFFRTKLEAGRLDSLSLRRTFFGRSLVENTSFRNTDLSESNLCWNDFVGVDFAECSLANGDLRASLYHKVSFARADLSGADLRRSSFKGCDFANAKMKDAKLTRAQADALRLSDQQVGDIDWQDEDGPEPDGG